MVSVSDTGHWASSVEVETDIGTLIFLKFQCLDADDDSYSYCDVMVNGLPGAES